MKKSSSFQVSSFRLKTAGLLLLIFGMLGTACHSGTKKTETASQSDESGIAKFALSEEIHNFGPLKSGEIVSFTFVFKNEGTKTQTISGVDSGCGCIEVRIPKKSVAPGEEGQLEVIYNSAGEVGNQLKAITIFSNAEPSQKQIIIRATVSNEIIEIHS
jgi:hypothetical protein